LKILQRSDNLCIIVSKKVPEEGVMKKITVFVLMILAGCVFTACKIDEYRKKIRKIR